MTCTSGVRPQQDNKINKTDSNEDIIYSRFSRKKQSWANLFDLRKLARFYCEFVFPEETFLLFLMILSSRRGGGAHMTKIH